MRDDQCENVFAYIRALFRLCALFRLPWAAKRASRRAQIKTTRQKERIYRVNAISAEEVRRRLAVTRTETL